jgi:hypothetical protein
MNNVLFNCPLLQFILLLILSEFIHRHFYDKQYSSASAGSIIMTIGIFYLSALQNLPFVNTLIIKLIAIELFIIWLYIVKSYVFCYIKCQSSIILIPHIKDQFAMGTWVAGCAVLAIIFSNEFPTWTILKSSIALLSFVIWLVYLFIIIANVCHIWLGKRKSHTGIILLSTVSTQSIVILIHTLFSAYSFEYLYRTLIIIGYIFYLIGLVTIIRYYIKIKPKRFIISWSNNNSIIHGALSISGLAGLLTRAIPVHIIILTWIIATFLFFLVESISLLKLYQRIKMAGLSKRIFTYDISQWSRLFTYGMYYAFSIAISENHLLSNSVTDTINNFGQYIVSGLLFIEIILLFNAKLRKPLKVS